MMLKRTRVRGHLKKFQDDHDVEERTSRMEIQKLPGNDPEKWEKNASEEEARRASRKPTAAHNEHKR